MREKSTCSVANLGRERRACYGSQKEPSPNSLLGSLCTILIHQERDVASMADHGDPMTRLRPACSHNHSRVPPANIHRTYIIKDQCTCGT